MDTITGCWKGALIPDAGGSETTFALSQPPRSLTPTSGTTLVLGGGVSTPARLLEGATQALVALVEDHLDNEGSAAGLLLEARVRGDRMVGSWMRRAPDGSVVGSGRLTAIRTASV
ncbi:MAG: hypothetical protein V4617_17355 [Gemmatimonadota bacterium]